MPAVFILAFSKGNFPLIKPKLDKILFPLGYKYYRESACSSNYLKEIQWLYIWDDKDILHESRSNVTDEYQHLEQYNIDWLKDYEPN